MSFVFKTNPKAKAKTKARVKTTEKNKKVATSPNFLACGVFYHAPFSKGYRINHSHSGYLSIMEPLYGNLIY